MRRRSAWRPRRIPGQPSPLLEPRRSVARRERLLPDESQRKRSVAPGGRRRCRETEKYPSRGVLRADPNSPFSGRIPSKYPSRGPFPDTPLRPEFPRNTPAEVPARADSEPEFAVRDLFPGESPLLRPNSQNTPAEVPSQGSSQTRIRPSPAEFPKIPQQRSLSRGVPRPESPPSPAEFDPHFPPVRPAEIPQRSPSQPSRPNTPADGPRRAGRDAKYPSNRPSPGVFCRADSARIGEAPRQNAEETRALQKICLGKSAICLGIAWDPRQICHFPRQLPGICLGNAWAQANLPGKCLGTDARGGISRESGHFCLESGRVCLGRGRKRAGKVPTRKSAILMGTKKICGRRSVENPPQTQRPTHMAKPGFCPPSASVTTRGRGPAWAAVECAHSEPNELLYRYPSDSATIPGAWESAESGCGPFRRTHTEGPRPPTAVIRSPRRWPSEFQVVLARGRGDLRRAGATSFGKRKTYSPLRGRSNLVDPASSLC